MPHTLSLWPADTCIQQEALFAEFCTAVANRLQLDASRLRPETSWVHDLGISSVDVVKIVLLIRTRFGVKVTTSQAGRISTVGDAYLLIRQGL